MSNYIEFNDKIAFHPGYYVKELVEESGLTQEDFAKRLNTTPKNLSILIRGEQRLSIDIAAKLSRMLGTSINYWLNLQQTYDVLQAEYLLECESRKETEVFAQLDYNYFIKYFGLPDSCEKVSERIKNVREFLGVASLCVLKEQSLAVSFRSYAHEMDEQNIINANAMVQIAINKALNTNAPKFNRKQFEKAIEFAVLQERKQETLISLIKDKFLSAGVVLIVMPELKSSGINGATKKVDGKILLMVTEQGVNTDSFMFTLFHEIGHIVNGDYGVTFKNNNSDVEKAADKYAHDKLMM